MPRAGRAITWLGYRTALPQDDSTNEYFSQVFENIEIREETHKNLLPMP